MRHLDTSSGSDGPSTSRINAGLCRYFAVLSKRGVLVRKSKKGEFSIPGHLQRHDKDNNWHNFRRLWVFIVHLLPFVRNYFAENRHKARVHRWPFHHWCYFGAVWVELIRKIAKLLVNLQNTLLGACWCCLLLAVVVNALHTGGWGSRVPNSVVCYLCTHVANARYGNRRRTRDGRWARLLAWTYGWRILIRVGRLSPAVYCYWFNSSIICRSWHCYTAEAYWCLACYLMLWKISFRC